MEQITTSSKDTKILDNAKLNLFQGETIGLVGINYSGKTTLVGGISGLFPYTSGRTQYLDKPVRITSIEQARKIGIYYIQPTSSLIDDLSVAENIFLSPEKHKGILIHRKQTNQKARQLLDLFGLNTPEHSAVDSLKLYERIVVEVCRAILNDAKIIIFDNVLSSLSYHESNLFNILLDNLRSRCVSLIMVEARIRLLTTVCERLFILRDGRTVGILKREEFNDDKIVSLMVGYNVKDSGNITCEFEKHKTQKLLSIKHVYYKKTLKDLSFTIYYNEILGLLNVNKNSGKAIERLLMGIAAPDSGEIKMLGKKLILNGTSDALAHGIATVPEDNAMLSNFSLGDNIVLAAMKTTSHFGILNKHELRYLKDELISQYLNRELLINSDIIPDGWLYLKKIAICRALATSPKLIVLVNPTQRVDFLSKQLILEDVLSFKKQRITTLVISTNINELINVCERILVVREGCVCDSFAVRDEQMDKIRMKYGKYLKDV